MTDFRDRLIDHKACRAAGPSWPAREAELRRCADDCRELLPLPVLNLKGESA